MQTLCRFVPKCSHRIRVEFVVQKWFAIAVELLTDRKNLFLRHFPQPGHIRPTGDLNQTGIARQKPGKIVETVVQQLKIKTRQQQLLLVEYFGGLKPVLRGLVLPGLFNKI